jgi:hypothetical protein
MASAFPGYPQRVVDRQLFLLPRPPAQGATIVPAIRIPDQDGEHATVRAAQLGRATCRRSTAISCNRTRISAPLAASLRAGSTSQPSTWTIPERKELNEKESVD